LDVLDLNAFGCLLLFEIPHFREIFLSIPVSKYTYKQGGVTLVSMLIRGDWVLLLGLPGSRSYGLGRSCAVVDCCLLSRSERVRCTRRVSTDTCLVC
jgi:hypothetical protein